MKGIKYITTAAITGATFFLSACAGSSPAVNAGTTTVAEPAEQPATVPAQANEAREADSANAATTNNDAAIIPSSSSKAVAPAISSSSVSSNSSPVNPDEVARPSDNSTAPDPYTAFPALANEVLAYADTLYKMDLTDSASAYLERFRVIKPLWNQWEAKADSMLNEFGKTRAEKAKAFEPMVLEIQNMNRANAAYSLVAEAVDSLIAKAPGDSLVNWAKLQVKTARENAIRKAQKEKAEILQMAESRGLFEDAMKKAQEFQLRYRDFEAELTIAQMIAYIDKLSNDVSDEAKKYWESHNPAEALAQADSLMKADKYSEAKDILNKLKASTLRKEAYDKYQELADTFCNAQRKITSQMFTKAQKQKDASKKKELLQKAIDSLNTCIDEYPEYEKIKTVLDNKIFLEKEMGR